MPGPAIETDGLSKQYGEATAVEDLSLSVPYGTVYGFLGPNGAGKTTTMRMLTTLTPPTSGSATVGGVSITDREAVTRRIGYLPADPPIYPELTGREQLRYVARLHGMDHDAATDRIERLLTRFDLDEDADQRIASYSTGMRKKVGIIAAVLHDPDIVLLDEPTTGLDPRAARLVRESIAEFVTQDMCVLLSTHILPLVDELADTVGIIHDGRLVAEGTPAEIKRRSRADDRTDLEEAFLNLTREEAPSQDAPS